MQTKEVTVFVFYFSCKTFSKIHCNNKSDEKREKDVPKVLYKKRKKRKKRKIRKEMTEGKSDKQPIIIKRAKG